MLLLNKGVVGKKPPKSDKRIAYIKYNLTIEGRTVGGEGTLREVCILNSGKIKFELLDVRIHNREFMKQIDKFKACLPTIYEESEVDWVGDTSRKGIIDECLKDLG